MHRNIHTCHPQGTCSLNNHLELLQVAEGEYKYYIIVLQCGNFKIIYMKCNQTFTYILLFLKQAG